MNSDDSKDQPLFVSLIPHLMRGQGHIVPYHGAVRRSVECLGWQYQAWVPQDTDPNLEEIGDRLHRVLLPEDLEAEGSMVAKLTRLPKAMECGNVLAQQLKPLLNNGENRPVILFLERFIHFQLFAVWWGLRQLSPPARQRLHFWILYRRDVHLDQTRSLYHGLHQRLRKLLPPPQCQFLTDSEPLGRSLQDYFRQPFTVMPIPHTDFAEVVPLSIQADPILCWWPGAPREEKGWSVMRSLVSSPWHNSPKLQIIAAVASGLKSNSEGIEVHLIGDRLTRGEYTNWLNKAQIILLPYDPEAYAERTSGIFTEAIIAERIPLASPGTWMARELNQYGLNSLVMDWQTPSQGWTEIAQRLADPTIHQQLAAMAQAYRRHHSLENYAKTLQEVWLSRHNGNMEVNNM
ncbi:glycosyltransferase [Synechocystis sp. PCC 7338]|uniref:glycosyltransferase n=1 Tax=Synechocystis sp. PCC 7338 TaxID=2732530 RepID=UPI001BAF9184|nr:hypothetical protein [Synechocystis sp. PCC 7338]QUS59785.1 hypothetical protein HTZ78_03225 [Synechocystis sp. PCC 7338]